MNRTVIYTIHKLADITKKVHTENKYLLIFFKYKFISLNLKAHNLAEQKKKKK